MSIKITIPNSSSDVLTFGSGNTPTAAQIAGIDSGSSNGQLALYTTASGTSTERVRVDASGNVGIGRTPSAWTTGGGGALQGYSFGISSTNTGGFDTTSFVTNAYSSSASAWAYVGTATAARYDQFSANHIWYGAASGTAGNAITWLERMRIDTSGNLLVGTTSLDPPFNRVNGTAFRSDGGIITRYTTGSVNFGLNATSGTSINFYTDNGSARVSAGTISSNGSTTAYNTSSDYRLKENIAPMTGALAKVAQLNPVTYNWKSDGSASQGFIAHEVQEIVPDCVYGEKDAVDAEGNPVYQGIDTSFLVATLTAAIQEQQAIITSLTDRITALEGATS